MDLAGHLLQLTVWLALLCAVFVPLERLFGIRKQALWRRQIVADLFYFFFNGLLLGSLLAFPVAVLGLLAHQLVPHAVLNAAAGLPLWGRLLAALVVGDIGAYWGHRWTHEIPLLWRFHAVHHSAEQIDWLVNTRAHPVDLVFTRLCGLVPLFVLGLAQPNNPADILPALAAVVGTAWGFFVHANVRFRFGWLEGLLATPAFHHWHHTNDAMRDRNYAAILPPIDLLFRSFHLPKSWPQDYGIDAPMPEGVIGQLLKPLEPEPDQTRNSR